METTSTSSNTVITIRCQTDLCCAECGVCCVLCVCAVHVIYVYTTECYCMANTVVPLPSVRSSFFLPLLPLPSSSGTQCEVGKYQPLEGKVTCKADQCAQGTYGNGGVGGGSVGRDSPQACENCPQGRYDVYIIMVYYIL